MTGDQCVITLVLFGARDVDSGGTWFCECVLVNVNTERVSVLALVCHMCDSQDLAIAVDSAEPLGRLMRGEQVLLLHAENKKHDSGDPQREEKETDTETGRGRRAVLSGPGTGGRHSRTVVRHLSRRSGREFIERDW
jgi:hypothetical protein